MPFLAAIPALASAFGATLPSALTIGLPAAAGALGVAQGIAKKDPLQAVMGAASAIPGIGAATSAAAPAASTVGSTIPASIGSRVASALDTAGNIPAKAILGASKALASSGQSVPLLQQIGAGITGVGNAASGVMALINAFKDHSANSPMNISPMGGGNLSASGGAQVGSLPQVPQLSSQSPGQVPNYHPLGAKPNDLLLQLLGSYRS